MTERRRLSDGDSGTSARCNCGWESGRIGRGIAEDEAKDKAFYWHKCLFSVTESHGSSDKTLGPLEQFDAAIQTVTQQRGEVYGHPVVDFDRAHRLIAVVEECPDPLIRQAMRMICVKLARLVQSPLHSDTAIDISGYARCIAMIQEYRNGNPLPKPES